MRVIHSKTQVFGGTGIISRLEAKREQNLPQTRLERQVAQKQKDLIAANEKAERLQNTIDENDRVIATLTAEVADQRRLVAQLRDELSKKNQGDSDLFRMVLPAVLSAGAPFGPGASTSSRGSGGAAGAGSGGSGAGAGAGGAGSSGGGAPPT